jgi:hypothetical protein
VSRHRRYIHTCIKAVIASWQPVRSCVSLARLLPLTFVGSCTECMVAVVPCTQSLYREGFDT